MCEGSDGSCTPCVYTGHQPPTSLWAKPPRADLPTICKCQGGDGGSDTTNGTATNLTLCVGIDTLSCDACTTPAPGSSHEACELTGAKRGLNVGAEPRDGWIVDWNSGNKAHCLSQDPSVNAAYGINTIYRCDYRMLSNGCDFRDIRDCGSEAQGLYVVNVYGAITVANGWPQGWTVRNCSLETTKTTGSVGSSSGSGSSSEFRSLLAGADQSSLSVVGTQQGVQRTCRDSCDSAECRPQYNGMEMYCEALYCPAETISTIVLGLCEHCHGKDAVLTFPRTRVLAAPVTIACPTSHHGALTRTCGVAGWQTTGRCVRKTCPLETIDFSEQRVRFLGEEGSLWASLGPDYRTWGLQSNTNFNTNLPTKLQPMGETARRVSIPCLPGGRASFFRNR